MDKQIHNKTDETTHHVADRPTASQVEQLLVILQQQIHWHDRLLVLLSQKRTALKQADYQRVTDVCQLEHVAIDQVSQLEKKRLQSVADISLCLNPDAAEPLRLLALAQQLDEPERGKLLVMRTNLVQRMQQVSKETNIAKCATESLAKHMQGLMQTLGAVCNGISSYNHQGAPPKKALAISTFSMTA